MLDSLNGPQREAATYLGGPLLILAGAGSGKTRVLVARIAYLLSLGVSPFRILAITFTNKAADEMRERVEQLVGPRARDIWVSTFHAACVRILRREIEKLGYARNFAILDADDQRTLVRQVLKELNLSEKHFPPGAVAAAISGAKNELLGPGEYLARARDWLELKYAEVYKLYQERLRQSNALDFDDIIRLTVQLFDEFPAVREYYQRKFEHVLVDEYQDTNHAQYVLVRHLAGYHRNLCVVGDDDQGIYSWRGATIRNILEFEQDWPDAHVVKLEQNYRSTGNILDAAYHVVRNNRGRKEKRLFTTAGPGEPITRYQARDEYDEAAYVADRIEEGVRRGRRYGDFAILYRTHAQSRTFEEVFVQRGIPYGIVGGLKFFERKEIKDVLAYLRLIANPADLLSFRRAIQVPRRGIGEATLERLEAHALATGLPILEVARRAHKVPGLGKAHAAKVQAFAQLIDELVAYSREHTVAELIEAVYTRSGILAEIQASENELEAQSRIENLRELKSAAVEPPEPLDPDVELTPLEDFLARVALVAEADTYEEGQDKVVMMTLHAAKGLEFPVVFMVGMEEGVFPSYRADEEDRLEEERRLCYVGMTRAREKLYLTHAYVRTLYGNTRHNAPSRFLDEVPPHLVEVEGEDYDRYSAFLGDPDEYGWGGYGGYRQGYGGGYGRGSGRGNGRRDSGYGRRERAGSGWDAGDEEAFSPPIGSRGWAQAYRMGGSRSPGAPAADSPAGPGGAPGGSGAPDARGAAPAPAFRPGETVWHPKFGEGIVQKVEGDVVTVHFAGVGEKVLIASYLQRV